VIDVAPTILEVAGIPEPREVNRVPLPPIEGISMAYTFGDEAAPGRRITQYFEMLGNRALYHDGWVAGCLHGRLPWLSGRAPSTPSTCSVRRGHAADGVVVLVGRLSAMAALADVHEARRSSWRACTALSSA
jgi:arylsulfatase A-like enzyme